jgi:hypothetical protein
MQVLSDAVFFPASHPATVAPERHDPHESRKELSRTEWDASIVAVDQASSAAKHLGARILAQRLGRCGDEMKRIALKVFKGAERSGAAAR